MEYLDQVWNYKFSILPVLSVYLVFEISTIIRRLMRIAYTPIYFMFFPLGHADSLYSYYFNEDDLYVGASQTPDEKRRTRKKIISISVFSMVFATVFNPAFAGVFAAYFVTEAQYGEFFWFLVLIKTAMIAVSLYNVRRISFVDRSGSFPWLIIIYVAYLVIVSRVVDASYQWASKAISEVGGSGLLFAMVDFFVFDFLIYTIFVALAGAAISYWMTDPDYIPEMEVICQPELVHEE